MSDDPPPSAAMNEELSSSSDGGLEGSNLYTSSPNSTPPPPTCNDIDRWRYHIELEKFGESLHAAAQAVFPNDRGSRYTDVSVLMLSWADEDPNLPVSVEIDKLQFIFQNVYRFDTEHWKIPAQASHYMTNQRVMDFVKPRDDSSSHLKIVYYAGHARLMDTRALALTSWQNNKKSKPPMVKWSAIQTLLEEDPSDVLILLDCCASGTANACEGSGVNELISACAWNEVANGVGPYSFTNALVIELRRLSQKPSFSVGELYRNIFWRTQSRMPEDLRLEGRERERHPAPIHLVLTQDTIPRSIQLSAPRQRARIGNDGAQIKMDTNHEKNSTSDSMDSIPQCETTSCQSTKDASAAKPSIPQSSNQEIVDKSKVPRLAFAIRLHESFKPSEDIKDLFLQWLRDMPNIAQQVKIEAGFDAFSTLLIVSLPLTFCAYLPNDPALISLGPITSGNRVSGQSESPEVHEPMNSLPYIDRSSSHMVGTHSVSAMQTVPEIVKSETAKGKMPASFTSPDLNLTESEQHWQKAVPRFEDLALAPVLETQPLNLKYSTVSVLLLSWNADRFTNFIGMSQILKTRSSIGEAFKSLYGFQVEDWFIPDQESHDRLRDRLFTLPNTGGHLNILYYCGRSLNTRDGIIWKSNKFSSRNPKSQVAWSGLQDQFNHAHSDTLLLFDCFADPPSPSIKYFGITELISADWRTKDNDTKPLGMFSDALLRCLTTPGKQNEVFTAKALAAHIYAEMERRCKHTGTLNQFRLTYSGRGSVRLGSIKDAPSTAA